MILVFHLFIVEWFWLPCVQSYSKFIRGHYSMVSTMSNNDFTGHWIVERDKWVLQAIIPGQDKAPIRDWDECTCFDNRVCLFSIVFPLFKNEIRLCWLLKFWRESDGGCVGLAAGIGQRIHQWMFGFRTNSTCIRFCTSQWLVSCGYRLSSL